LTRESAAGTNSEMTTGYFRTLVPNLADAVARFPGPVTASLAMGGLANLMIAEKDFAGSQFYADLLWCGVAAFLASGSMHLFAEAARWPRQKGAVIAILTGLLAALGYWFHTELGLHRIFFTAGLVLLVLSAAYLRAGASQAAFWLFDFRLGVAALVSVVVTGIACGGITAILASLEFLFDVKVPNDLYPHVWATGATVVGPIYGLAITPKSLAEEIDVQDYQSSMVESGASVVINWVLVPLTLVYAVVLYAYAVKISTSWTLPKGQIGTLVMLFALTGTAAYMISYPWRDEGSALLRWFRSSWFILTVVPVVLLIVGTWRRISDYGITPDRYALLVLAFWLAGIAGFAVLRRGKIDIRLIMASLAIIMVMGSIGPWGARTISAKDQFARLESLLVGHGLLKEGKLADPLPPAHSVPVEARQAAVSIIRFLVEEGEHDRLRRWLAGSSVATAAGKTADPRPVADRLVQVLGFASVERLPADLQRVDFEASASGTFTIPAGSEVRGPIRLSSFAPPRTLPDDASAFRVETAGSTIIIVRGGNRWSVSANELLTEAAGRAGPRTEHQRSFTVVSDAAHGRLTLIVERISGQLSKEEAKIDSAVVWLILPPEPATR
jgi:hypothetical protein